MRNKIRKGKKEGRKRIKLRENWGGGEVEKEEQKKIEKRKKMIYIFYRGTDNDLKMKVKIR